MRAVLLAALTLGLLLQTPLSASADEHLTPGEEALSARLLADAFQASLTIPGDTVATGYRGCRLDRHGTGPCLWRVRVYRDETRRLILFRRDGRAQLEQGRLVDYDVPALRRGLR